MPLHTYLIADTFVIYKNNFFKKATCMPKFLHTADWQIGRLYSTFDPEHAPLLAEARIAAVERLAGLATQHQVDAVLVAGDVFDDLAPVPCSS